MPKAPKVTVRSKKVVAPKAPQRPKEAWKAEMPKKGSGTQAWRDWGKSRPGRVPVAGGALGNKSIPSSNPDPVVQAQAVRAWQSERPSGGVASQAEFRAWGNSNPNRKSNAGRALASARKKKP